MVGRNRATVEWVKTAQGNKYIIDGVRQPDLTLVRGETYVFEVNARGHPFHIATTPGGGDFRSIYTNGVSADGLLDTRDGAVQRGTLTFRPPPDAPANLYYVCGVHRNMGAGIEIVSPPR